MKRNDQLEIREFMLRPDINYMVHDWMPKRLGLTGYEIMVFAYIYACEQPTDYARTASATGMSESGARQVINRLLTKDLLTKVKKKNKWGYLAKKEIVHRLAFSTKKTERHSQQKTEN